MARNILPRTVQRLIDEFARLPGIGPKSASRLTFYLLRGTDNLALDLATALQELKAHTRFCSICFNITEADPCVICGDEGRDPTLLCVVEEPLDVVAIERSRAFNGRYHVLHGAISPVEGIGPEDLMREKFSLHEMKRAGATAAFLRQNKKRAGELARAGYTLVELHHAGYPALELRKLNASIREMLRAGYTFEELVHAKYPREKIGRAIRAMSRSRLTKR